MVLMVTLPSLAEQPEGRSKRLNSAFGLSNVFFKLIIVKTDLSEASVTIKLWSPGS